jgi:hypothetical protein
VKWNSTHQLLVHIDEVNLFGENVHTMKKNTEAFLVGSKETGIELETAKQYVFIF